jgi:hypothetical protein
MKDTIDFNALIVSFISPVATDGRLPIKDNEERKASYATRNLPAFHRREFLGKYCFSDEEV